MHGHTDGQPMTDIAGQRAMNHLLRIKSLERLETFVKARVHIEVLIILWTPLPQTILNSNLPPFYHLVSFKSCLSILSDPTAAWAMAFITHQNSAESCLTVVFNSLGTLIICHYFRYFFLQETKAVFSYKAKLSFMLKFPWKLFYNRKFYCIWYL